MASDGRYEVIWNMDAALDLQKYVEFAKTTAEDVYVRTQFLLSSNPHNKGKRVKFKGFEYDGYRWLNVKNLILIYEIFDKEKIVAIDASYFANNARSAEVFYGVDPNEGWS